MSACRRDTGGEQGFLGLPGRSKARAGADSGPGLFLDNRWSHLSLHCPLSVDSQGLCSKGEEAVRVTGIFCAGSVEEDSSRAAHPLLFCTWKNTRN